MHVLVNLGQSEDQSPLSSMQNLGFFEHENAKKKKKKKKRVLCVGTKRNKFLKQAQIKFFNLRFKIIDRKTFIMTKLT